MVEVANPLAGVGISGLGLGLLIFFLAIVVVAMIGFGVYYYATRKQLKYTIPLHKMIGGRPIKVATYKAKDYRISLAGDKLWFIPKIKKYISPASIQSAPNEYSHFEREDGEWINFGLGDIDAEMKNAGVKYIATDMRSQRIAISNLLEQRFKGKQSFWEKYGNLIAQVIFYLMVCVCMVIIFYQFSIIVDKISTLFDKVVGYEQLKCPVVDSLVPASVGLILRRKK